MPDELVAFYVFDPFRIDLKQRLLLRDETPIALTPKAFDTLLVLVRNSGQIVTKDDLMKSVWPDIFVEEATLSQNIFTLRKVLGGESDVAEHIRTIPKRGYCFLTRVTEIRTGIDDASAEGQRIGSIAVLPMINTVADPNAEYLSDGFSAIIIDCLSLLPDLQVKAWSTVARYKEQEINPQEAGRALGVGAVLTGKVISFDQSIIVHVELIEVAHGWHLWGAQYNQQLVDLIKVKEEILKHVSAKLGLRLDQPEWKRLKQLPRNGEAYRLYLQGRYFLNKRTRLGYTRAIDAFKRALEVDPINPLAYSGLADSYVLYDFFGLTAPSETIPKARAAAARAIELDDELAESHSTLGSLKLSADRDPIGAEKEFKRAIQLNPKYARAHDGYAQCLIEMRRMEESLAECKLALELEPFDLEVNKHLGWHYLFTRQYDQAIEQLTITLEMGPDFYRARMLLGIAYGQKGLFSEAIDEFHRARKLEHTPVLSGFLGHAYGRAERKKEALALLAELLKESKRRYVPPHSVALIYVGLGKRDLALDWLEKACVEHSHWRGWLQLTPELDSLRSDLRFIEAFRHML